MNALARIIASLLPQPSYILKDNAFFDFSHWEQVKDWSRVVFPAGTVGLITKATQGDWMDETFLPYFAAFKKLPYFRGAYHFFEPNNIAKQIDTYCSALYAGGWEPGDLVILDVEFIPPPENKKKPDNLPRGAAYAYQVKALLDGIESRMKQRPIIYWSRGVTSHMLDKHGNPPAWANDYLSWAAWYPLSAYIDKNPWVPASVAPLGVRPENIIGWQYATNWVLPGINYDGVDVNTASDSFVESLGKKTIPTPEPLPEDDPIVAQVTRYKSGRVEWMEL